MVVESSRTPRLRPGLSRFINQRDGMSAEEAKVRAATHLEFLSESVVADLNAVLQTLNGLVDTLAQGDRAETLQKLFTAANTVFSVAGTLGHDNLGAAARSLCRLVDIQQTGQLWEEEALRLHLQALNHLNPGRSVSNETAIALLAGLHEVTDRIARRVAEAPVTATADAVARGDRAILMALSQELHLLRERSVSIQELTSPLLQMVGMNQSTIVNVQAVDLVAQTLDQLVLFISRYLDLAASNPSAALAGSIQGITLGDLSRRLSEECLDAKNVAHTSDGVELFHPEGGSPTPRSAE
jgi:hypothetical protein